MAKATAERKPDRFTYVKNRKPVCIELYAGARRHLEKMPKLAGEKVARDFVQAYVEMNKPRNNAMRLVARDQVAAFLIACAKAEMLYMDVRKAADEMGMATVETVASRKHLLRRMGVVYEVALHARKAGRPRLRLHYNPDAYERVYGDKR